MVVILQWLMAKCPGRSAFTGVLTVVTIPKTLKWGTAALSMFTTSLVHRNGNVDSATVAMTDDFLPKSRILPVVEKTQFVINNPCVKCKSPPWKLIEEYCFLAPMLRLVISSSSLYLFCLKLTTRSFPLYTPNRGRKPLRVRRRRSAQVALLLRQSAARNSNTSGTC